MPKTDAAAALARDAWSVAEVAAWLDVPAVLVTRWCEAGHVVGARRDAASAWVLPGRGLFLFLGRKVEAHYSVETVAVMLDAQPETVRGWLKARRLRAVKLGGARQAPVRIAESELARWLKAGAVKVVQSTAGNVCVLVGVLLVSCCTAPRMGFVAGEVFAMGAGRIEGGAVVRTGCWRRAMDAESAVPSDFCLNNKADSTACHSVRHILAGQVVAGGLDAGGFDGRGGGGRGARGARPLESDSAAQKIFTMPSLASCWAGPQKKKGGAA